MQVMQQASVLTLVLVSWTCAQMAFLHASLVESIRMNFVFYDSEA